MDVVWPLQPFPPVVVGAPKPVTFDMLVDGELSKCPFELLPGQIQSIVVNFLAGTFESLEQQVHLTQVTTKSASGTMPDRGGLFRDIPTPELNEHGLIGSALRNLGSRFPEDLDLSIREVVLV